MMTSEILKKAREYEEKYDKFITEEQRPGFHLTPRVGWMNDPNGFCYYQGKYHIFYQYHPYSTKWGPMYWGHAVSEDLLNWTYLPAAIAPDMPYDKDGCFSGSAIELPNGKLMLMYTSVLRKFQEDGTFKDCQTQSIAVGDGTDFEKYSQNPVITDEQLPEGFSKVDFRDPKIFREDDGSYACVVGNRTDDESGSVLLFRSEDGYRWKFASVLERCYNEYGLMWECPDMFRLDGKDIIITSPQDMSPLGLEFHNGNGTMCLIGKYNRGTNFFDREKVQSIDYGLDFYAPQTVLTPDNRRIMIGWMQNWDTCNAAAPDARWFGQMSVPRELNFRNGRLVQNPVREIELLHGRRIDYNDIPLHEETSLQGIFGRMVDMTVTVNPLGGPDSYRMFRIKVARGSQHYTSICYYPSPSTVKLDRSHSGSRRDFVHERVCPVKYDGGKVKIRVILDRFSVEVFVNDGEQAMSAVISTPQTADGITFECSGDASMSVEKFEIL